MVFRKVKVRETERGFLFRDRELQRMLRPGTHWLVDPLFKSRVEVLSVRQPWVRTPNLDVIVKAGVLGDEAEVLNLGDSERALVWIDGRFDAVLTPGLYALWKVFHEVRVQRVDARTVRFEHERLATILASPTAKEALETVSIDVGRVGLFYENGRYRESLAPGTHAFWKAVARVKVVDVDLREQVADVTGQEIVTADKVTLRLNAVVTYRVHDPVKATAEVEDYRQALYREAQLALRAVIGTRELDALLTEKDRVSEELSGLVKAKTAAFGVEVTGLGIRDVILPGDMKDLLNKVTEAKKAATRR